MLGILADSFYTATRTNCIELQEVPPKNSNRLRRGFWRKRTVCIDPGKL